MDIKPNFNAVKTTPINDVYITDGYNLKNDSTILKTKFKLSLLLINISNDNIQTFQLLEGMRKFSFKEKLKHFVRNNLKNNTFLHSLFRKPELCPQ